MSIQLPGPVIQVGPDYCTWDNCFDPLAPDSLFCPDHTAAFDSYIAGVNVAKAEVAP